VAISGFSEETENMKSTLMLSTKSAWFDMVGKYIILLVLAILSIISFIYSIAKTVDPSGAIDFHSYWYAGHFVRQGSDPYEAYLQGLTPDVPVSYWDAEPTKRLPIAQPDLATVPANTAPMVLLLTPFSFLSWPLAKVLWLICNLLFMIAIPYMVFQVLPKSDLLNIYDKLILWLAFISFFGTRNIAGNGQTSLLIFALMMIALIVLSKHGLLAGLALGLALSKYSLSLPIFIFLLLKRKFRVVFIATGVQIFGLLVLSLITRTSPFQILQGYIQILRIHSGLPGIHLSTLFPQQNLLALVATLLMTVIVTVFLLKGRIKIGTLSGHGMTSNDIQLEDLITVTILVLWTLLVAYHRAYDTFLAILFIALIIYILANSQKWLITRIESTYLTISLLIYIVIMCLPASGISMLGVAVDNDFVATWLDFQGRGLTLMLLFMLASAIWLLFRMQTFWQRGKISH
jgi:hypothetical protein